MTKLKRLFGDLAASTLFAVALAGIIFPQHLFAQLAPPISQVAGVAAEGKIRIAVESLDEGSPVPARFRVEVGDRVVTFERSGSGYSWHDEKDASLGGFQSLPDLGEAASWQVDYDDDGFFHAGLPLDAFDPAEEPAAVVPDKVGEEEAKEPILDTYGYYDAASKTVQLSAIAPSSELFDVEVSFAGLPEDAEVRLMDVWGGVPSFPNKGPIIVIPIGLLLLLLGVAIIVCAVFHQACFTGCSYECTWGVKRVISAICGVSCTCECNDPPHPCSTVAPGVEMMSLSDAALPFKVAPTPFGLTRLEDSGVFHHGEQIRYLMGEWALLTYTGGKAGLPQVEVAKTSSEAYARTRAADLTRSLWPLRGDLAPGRHSVLMVSVPDHPDNTRSIALPELHLEDARLAGVGEGEALVLADFADDRSLQELTVLDDTVGGLTPAAVEQLRGALSLDYFSDDSHRVVAFAVVELGESPQLKSSFAYMPKCCCNFGLLKLPKPCF